MLHHSNQSLTNIPIFRCGRIRVSYDSPQYLKANVVFDKEMPSYDYSVAIGINSNVLDSQLYTMKTEAYMDLEFPYIKLTQILRALTA